MRTVPTAILLAALALAACATAPGGGTAFTGRAKVNHPEALFDVASRSAALQRNDGRTGARIGERVCPRERDLVDYEPLVGPSLAAMDAGAAYTRAPRDFGRALNVSAYRVLLDQDMARAARDIAVLRAHAERNAWLPAQENWSAAGAIVDGMLPVLPAWHILRQTSAATDADRQVIDGWLRRLALYTDIHPGLNNLGSARGANDMMLGLMLGDGARYRKGLQGGFYAQIGGMRPDGSFPLEADRGLSALENTNRNIALLVYAAQIAASQGQDLYAVRVEGRGLQDAIGFLLRAAEDNAVIDVYARTNRNPSQNNPVFAPNSQVSPFGNPARGWVKLYTDRFPGSPTAQELRALVPLGNRINNDTVGGFVTCYASRL
jgi:hypothetical protein